MRPSSGFRRAPHRTPAPGAADDTPYPPVPPPPIIPGYEVAYEIGVGGMSIVYLARELNPDRPVAIKVLQTAGVLDADGALRFAEEARIVSFLRHRDIVQLYDVGEAGGLSYLVLEYVSGPTLARLVGGRPQDPRVAARLIEQVARAVQYAHEQGIIHRDLKPGNILMAVADDVIRPDTPESASAILNLSLSAFQPKVTDFGLAKALADSPVQTAAGIAVGTPGYMAPEQAAGDRDHVGPWTDVYALGVILYELVTGQLPFPGDDTPAVLLATRTQTPPAPRTLRPNLPRELEAVIMKSLAKRPEDRYITATDLASDLRKFLDGQTVSAMNVIPASNLAGGIVPRSPLMTALLAAGLVLAGVGVEAAFHLSSLVRRGTGPEPLGPPDLTRKPPPAEAAEIDELWVKLAVLNGPAGDAMATEMVGSARQKVAALEKQNGPTSEAAIRARTALGRVLGILGRWDEAESVYMRAVADAREAGGPASPRVAKLDAALQAVRLRFAVAGAVGGAALLPGALTSKGMEP